MHEHAVIKDIDKCIDSQLTNCKRKKKEMQENYN